MIIFYQEPAPKNVPFSVRFRAEILISSKKNMPTIEKNLKVIQIKSGITIC